MTKSDLDWVQRTGDQLDAVTLHDLLAVRAAVFVVEQECAYLDVDGLDLAPGTLHLIARHAGEIAAYARILAPDETHPTPRIGRVIVTRAARGRQLGRRLLERAIAATEATHPGTAIELGAQAHLAGFYASLGFVAVGEPYDEDGIPHLWMRRTAQA
jgi:ElaA protein